MFLAKVNPAAVLTDNGHPWTPAFQRV